MLPPPLALTVIVPVLPPTQLGVVDAEADRAEFIVNVPELVAVPWEVVTLIVPVLPDAGTAVI